MFAFYTSLSKQGKYSKLCMFLTDLESDTQWGHDHWNLIEAFVYSEFDMLTSSKVECTAKFMRLLSTCPPRLGSQMEPCGN